VAVIICQLDLQHNITRSPKKKTNLDPSSIFASRVRIFVDHGTVSQADLALRLLTKSNEKKSRQSPFACSNAVVGQRPAESTTCPCNRHRTARWAPQPTEKCDWSGKKQCDLVRLVLDRNICANSGASSSRQFPPLET